MIKRMFLAALAVAFMAALPLSAHHAANTKYDANKPVKLQGTVTSVKWINPHTWIFIDVKKADGSVENWGVEAGTPNTLFRLGFTRDAVKVGTEILVDGYESRDGSKRANGRDMTLPDGRKLFMASSVGNDAQSK